MAQVYDGDTPQGERPALRHRAQLLITNPDMLHVSVLPAHAQFSRLLARLKFVIVDEGHAYKVCGRCVFGGGEGVIQVGEGLVSISKNGVNSNSHRNTGDRAIVGLHLSHDD